jgi:hypothetical protein
LIFEKVGKYRKFLEGGRRDRFAAPRRKLSTDFHKAVFSQD